MQVMLGGGTEPPTKPKGRPKKNSFPTIMTSPGKTGNDDESSSKAEATNDCDDVIDMDDSCTDISIDGEDNAV